MIFVKCLHAHKDDEPATAMWHMPHGCICFPNMVQPLCDQHAVKAENNGIEMYKLFDICGDNPDGVSD